MKMIFEISDPSVGDFHFWKQEHEEVCNLKGLITAIGGRYTYRFTPTSLGIIIKIECGCGSECDLTEYERW